VGAQEEWELVWGKLPGIEWDQIPAELERIAAADPGSRLEWIDHPPAEEVGPNDFCGRVLHFTASDGWAIARRTAAGMLRTLRMSGRVRKEPTNG